MTTVHDLHEQIEQVDLQILQLLQDRVKLVASAREDDEPAIVDDIETVALWSEEASDTGLDETIVEKLCRLTILLGKKGQEE